MHGQKKHAKFSIDELLYKNRLNLSLYAKVMVVLPNNMFLQPPQLGSMSNRLPMHHMNLMINPIY